MCAERASPLTSALPGTPNPNPLILGRLFRLLRIDAMTCVYRSRTLDVCGRLVLSASLSDRKDPSDHKGVSPSSSGGLRYTDDGQSQRPAGDGEGPRLNPLDAVSGLAYRPRGSR